MASATAFEGSAIPSSERASARMPTDPGLNFLAGGGEMGARMRSLDWAATPLGPAALWPQSLKTIVRVMLDSRYAMWMLWGPELTFFCNDAYLPTVGIKRDWVLGARSDKVWAEIWPDIGPRIEHVLAAAARRPGTRRCCSFSSAAASPKRPTTRSRTAPSTTTRAASPGCCASSPK